MDNQVTKNSYQKAHEAMQAIHVYREQGRTLVVDTYLGRVYEDGDLVGQYSESLGGNKWILEDENGNEVDEVPKLYADMKEWEIIGERFDMVLSSQ